MSLPSTAVDYETLTWAPAEQYGQSRTARRKQVGAYRAAVTADIAELELVLPSSVHAEAADASQEIARFDAELGTDIAPFASVLLRSESAASSRIENLTASARAIAEAELGDPSKRNATLIVANTVAMKAAVRLADHIDANAILQMHAALMHGQDRHLPGAWRTEQVWIGGSDHGPIGALFVPPRHERVGAAIDDLLAYIARTDVPALPQIAIAHAQFESIHPFTDGNGRTGRALVQAQMRHTGLTRAITIPVSAGLLANTDAYFDALTAYRDGDAAPIVQRFGEASFRAVTNGRHLLADLRSIRSGWADRINTRPGTVVYRLADLLLKRPVVDAALVETELGIRKAHVYRNLDPLVEAGIILETTTYSRNRIWRVPEVLAALDAFAERAGRRGPGVTS
ncbi:Fic family protein [[Mycobacterium] vasticus]|uniref:Fic family protein n=1 Tax=[Mycobacterium] vasticus TaxID=2875777 RepID=A0ABU5Z322_9MYCO|nr:Fic family protein [Mycolicibacter sp. MYC017]MEB3070624.1 Fic family protein [Mycolicibacter sp. MYC017]